MEEGEVLPCQPPKIMDISSGNCYDPSELDEPKRESLGPSPPCDIRDPGCTDPCGYDPSYPNCPGTDLQKKKQSKCVGMILYPMKSNSAN